MAERRFPYRIAWLVVLACLLGGAGLSLSQNRTTQNIGLWLLVTPLLVFALLSVAFYVRTRRA